MAKHKYSLSVVIPAHNEESCIEACIKSLISQNIPPEEIIVVVNAAIDKTAEIARKYKQVQVVEVDKKSITNARDIGFNLAKSDIIARLNADVICPVNWTDRLLNNFSDPNITAVTGPAKARTLPLTHKLSSTFWSIMYLNLAEVYFGFVILWGANMAIRRSAWEQIKKNTCPNDYDVHEDQDISLHLAERNMKMVKDKHLIVGTKEDSYFDWGKFRAYNKLRIKTKKSHAYIYTDNKIIRTSYLKRIYLLLISSVPAAIFYFSSILKVYIRKLYKLLVR